MWAEMANFEEKFWREQVDDPAHMIMSGATKTIATHLEGDAPVAAALALTYDHPTAHQGPIYQPSGPRAKRQKMTLAITAGDAPPISAPPTPTWPANTTGRQDLSVWDAAAGRYTKNKNGLKPCPDHQTGVCGPSTFNNLCPWNPPLTHQCEICCGLDMDPVTANLPEQVEEEALDERLRKVVDVVVAEGQRR